MDVSDAEALDHYVAGLKQSTRDWVLIHDPRSLHNAALWAERYDNMYYSRGKANAASQQSSGGQCHLAAASSHKAATTLPVGSLIYKVTASILASVVAIPGPEKTKGPESGPE